MAPAPRQAVAPRTPAHASRLLPLGPSPMCGRPQVTEGPHAGKLALLDFGLVAEIPPADRQVGGRGRGRG
jgi:hypothetical protein